MNLLKAILSLDATPALVQLIIGPIRSAEISLNDSLKDNFRPVEGQVFPSVQNEGIVATTLLCTGNIYCLRFFLINSLNFR